MIMAHAVAKDEHADIGGDLDGFDELVNEPMDISTLEDHLLSRETSGINSTSLDTANSPLAQRSTNEIMIWRTPIPTITADICNSQGVRNEQLQNTKGTGPGGSSAALNKSSSTRSGDVLRRLSINLTDGIKRMGSIGFRRLSSLSRGNRSYEASSYTSPTQGLHTMASVACTFEGHEVGHVEVFTAPVKTIERMREKVLEYATEGCGDKWPLCANILDPVRASVVCNGPAQILQVLQWFAGSNPSRTSEVQETIENGATVRLLPLCRVKNKFAFPKEELVGG